jgi:VIT1/CCC1 family predicted Fe2+/Mn2+ transporter
MDLEHEHTPEAIRERLEEGPRASYLRDWIYGGIDGAVTTFAVVSGVAGADLSHGIILILGGANLVADGFSMAAGNFSGTRAEIEEQEMLRRVEQRHIEQNPEGEREEIRQIFAAKGLSGEPLEQVVEAVTENRERWIATMLSEEYGLPQEIRSPFWAGTNTFLAFLLCGAVPLFPYAVGLANPFLLSIVMTGLVFFAIGAARSRWSVMAWWKAGLETLLIGGVAAILAYGIGYALAALVPGV